MTALILIVAVVWVVVPTLVGLQIGAEKGRQGWAWGLFLGWLGVLIVAVLPPSPEHERAAAIQAAALYRQCPHCKEQMRRDATVCPHCRGVSPADTKRGELPPEAEALLNVAEEHLQKGHYFLAIATIKRTQDDALFRGDVRGLEAASKLAARVVAAPGVNPQVRDDAQEFVQAAHEQIAKLRVTADVADDKVAADAESPRFPDETAAVDGSTSSSSALEIARDRYARGEISRDEFLQLQSDLAES